MGQSYKKNVIYARVEYYGVTPKLSLWGRAFRPSANRSIPPLTLRNAFGGATIPCRRKIKVNLLKKKEK